jgi:NADPH:quinone reductase-like Zn-dependent oxidoreductase
MLIARYGGPDRFEAGEVATPRPGPGEVLVRVRGSSVNPVDAAMRAGMLRSFVRLRLPAVLGLDVAGEVAEVGEAVTRFAVGERVFGYTGLAPAGGYGEYAMLPESSLARVPAGPGWAQAGTVPGVGASASEAFTVQTPVRPGMRCSSTAAPAGWAATRSRSPRPWARRSPSPPAALRPTS